MTRVVTLALATWIAWASTARADGPFIAGQVVAARDTDAVALSLDDGTTRRVWTSADGTDFHGLADLPAHERTLDMLIDADGSLLLAETRNSPTRIVVMRHGVAAGEWSRGATIAGEQAVLGWARSQLVVVTDEGVWRMSSERTRAVALTRWKQALLDASLRETRSGAMDLLITSFDFPSCEGPGRLAGLTRILVTPELTATIERVPLSLSAYEEYFVRGGDGTVYGTGEPAESVVDDGVLRYVEPTTCALRASSPRQGERRLLTRTERSDLCTLHFGSLGRLSVLVLGEKVFELANGGARELGVLAPREHVLSVAPDRHGRALVLLRDGRLFRYAPQGPREQLRYMAP